jgi:hypothetical protein
MYCRVLSLASWHLHAAAIVTSAKDVHQLALLPAGLLLDGWAGQMALPSHPAFRAGRFRASQLRDRPA